MWAIIAASFHRMSIYFRFELFHTNLCFSAPLPALTEQQAAVTIPGTNLTIPLSAFTGNQPMIIPGANISLGGVQIPVSQGISIPSSAGVQLPVAPATGAVQLGAGGDKAGDGAKDCKPASPSAPGRCAAACAGRAGELSAPSFYDHWSSSTVRSIAQLLLCFCSLFRSSGLSGRKVLPVTNPSPCLLN